MNVEQINLYDSLIVQVDVKLLMYAIGEEARSNKIKRTFAFGELACDTSGNYVGLPLVRGLLPALAAWKGLDILLYLLTLSRY